MSEPRKSGRLRWDRLAQVWLLEEEWDDLADDISWIPTHWWVRKERPYARLRLGRWEVLMVTRGRDHFRVIKKFWRLKNAKAYAEVCYRMGVRYDAREEQAQ